MCIELITTVPWVIYTVFYCRPMWLLSELGRDDRAVFKKIFGSVKKHAQRNVSADSLYVCTIVMPGKAIWRL